MNINTQATTVPGNMKDGENAFRSMPVVCPPLEYRVSGCGIFGTYVHTDCLMHAPRLVRDDKAAEPPPGVLDHGTFRTKSIQMCTGTCVIVPGMYHYGGSIWWRGSHTRCRRCRPSNPTIAVSLVQILQFYRAWYCRRLIYRLYKTRRKRLPNRCRYFRPLFICKNRR